MRSSRRRRGSIRSSTAGQAIPVRFHLLSHHRFSAQGRSGAGDHCRGATCGTTCRSSSPSSAASWPCRSAEQSEKVCTIEELAARFKVSTKTINRWRRRGLLARKFVFDDGTHRLGFLESAVERFARENPRLGRRTPGRFRRLTDVQRQQVIRQARTLAAEDVAVPHQITGQIAEKLGIARETARTILQQYEKKHPDKPVFRRPLGRIRPAEAVELFRLYKQGTGIRQLMERFDRSRATVHRIINQRRAAALLARKIEYVPSDEFLQAEAREQILGTPLTLDRPETDEEARTPGTRR